jgi:hypothetical protein
MERRQSMTSDDPETAAASLEADLARTLGRWVAALAGDALSVGETSQLFPPGAPLRAPLRAGLRHLLHIARLSHGIEALAMLEVALVLRVTALLASPAEELDSETILRLRADTPLIEDLFPEEREVLWQFCESLIASERLLPSEQAAAFEEGSPAATRVPDLDSSEHIDGAATSTAVATPVPDDVVAESADRSPEDRHTGNGYPESPVSSELPQGVPAEDGERVQAAPDLAPSAALPPLAVEDELAPPDEPAPDEPAPPDELVERLRVWAASYRTPEFGTRPYDLTRARAFVRARVSAWSNT